MDILFSRMHPVMAARSAQVGRNRLALRGGRAYIDARLWRAPNESDLSWFGTGPQKEVRDIGCVGRRDRAAMVNDAGRIAGKIDQYLFQTPAARAGADKAWADDVTGDGQSLSEFWMDASDELTAGQWCWLQADRDAVSPGASLADRRRGDRIRWRVWPSVAVPDWCLSPDGSIEWLLTVETSLENSDPFSPAKSVETRTLWRMEDGRPCFHRYARGGNGVEVVAEGAVAGGALPFTLLGRPTDKPWWFDDVELLQAQLLNLDSLHVETLVRSVFPQLVIPTSMLDAVEARVVERVGQGDGRRVSEIVREIVRGLDRPLVESGEDKGTTRFIMPSAADIEALPAETARRRRALFDMVGLSLFNKESRQIESAESKQFDHLDTEATLRNRARILQAAERRLVAISRALDPSWRAYDPAWPDSFDVSDIAADMAALTQVGAMAHLTLTQRKVVLRAATKIIGQIVQIDADELARIDAEIDALAEENFSFPARSFAPGDDGGGG